MYDEPWIKVMAIELMREVTDWMTGISLTYCPEQQKNIQKNQMESILVRAGGETKISVQLRADAQMLFRLAQKMIGSDPEDDEEIREYAIEYVNVFCGRFISHLFSHWHEKTRYFFPEYETPPNITKIDEEKNSVSLFFLSEKQENVMLSWVIKHEETVSKEE